MTTVTIKETPLSNRDENTLYRYTSDVFGNDSYKTTLPEFVEMIEESEDWGDIELDEGTERDGTLVVRYKGEIVLREIKKITLEEAKDTAQNLYQPSDFNRETWDEVWQDAEKHTDGFLAALDMDEDYVIYDAAEENRLNGDCFMVWRLRKYYKDEFGDKSDEQFLIWIELTLEEIRKERGEI